jgi:hypothetical protein
MATLPRDPLDELIADLERALPAEAGPVQCGLPPIEGLHMLVSAIFSRTADAWAAATRDPRVRATLKDFERRGYPVRVPTFAGGAGKQDAD